MKDEEFFPGKILVARPPPAESLAEEHVSWFLNMLRPLLISHFVHGYKHGREDEKRRQIKDLPDGDEL